MIQTVLILLKYLILFVVCGITLYSDLRFNKIYNWVTLPLIPIGLLLNLGIASWKGLASSGLGFGVGFGIMLVFFLFGAMGGGDVKLTGGIGALLGYPFVLNVLLYSVFVGGCIAIAKLIWRGEFFKTIATIFRSFFSLILPGRTFVPIPKEEAHIIPYGCAIALGTVWALIMHWSIR